MVEGAFFGIGPEPGMFMPSTGVGISLKYPSSVGLFPWLSTTP